MLKDLVSNHSPPPSSNSSIGSHNGKQCGGCGDGIRDRFYLVAADRAWHGNCLRCCQCSHQLDAELSCFCRDGNIYCKEDYFRLFATRRCDRCGSGLGATELVMRARDLVFHVGCFSCSLCGGQLSAGDTAAIRDGRLLCAEHGCSADADNMHHSSDSSALLPFYGGSPQKGRPRKRKPNQPLSHGGSSSLGTGHVLGHNQQQQQQQQQQLQQQHQQHQHQQQAADMTGSDGIGGVGGGGCQPEITALSMEQMHHTDLPLSSLDLSYDGSQSPGSGIGSSSGGCGGGLGMGGGGSGGGSQSAHSRSKRMRTSFKHHQLRTMKSYFAINQNPDAKDLKQLAQKTGLSKRVLQVWFQNARAKWRRNVMRQDVGGGGGGGGGGVGGSGLGGGMIGGGGGGPLVHMAGNLTPLTHTSGGPPSVQSTASSSNLDGSGGSCLTPSYALEEMHHMSVADLY